MLDPIHEFVSEHKHICFLSLDSVPSIFIKSSIASIYIKLRSSPRGQGRRELSDTAEITPHFFSSFFFVHSPPPSRKRKIGETKLWTDLTHCCRHLCHHVGSSLQLSSPQKKTDHASWTLCSICMCITSISATNTCFFSYFLRVSFHSFLFPLFSGERTATYCELRDSHQMVTWD